MTETTNVEEPVPDYPIDAPVTVPETPSSDEVVIPVRIVEGIEPREIRDHRLYRIPCRAGKHTQLVGGNPYRRRLFVTNTHDTESLVLLREQGASPFTGFLLLAGQSVEIFSEQESWAIPSDSTDVVASVLDEFTIIQE